ncbi:MAG TPA: alginate export family protein [Bryobacteraceae bacterium]|nr:alginate export family protein [Bryobacteraceae bacterium]
MTRYFNAVVLLGCSGGLLAPAEAQNPPSAPLEIGGITVSGSLRTRVESWDWFGANANNSYTYPASILRLSFAEAKNTFDWQLEFALPFLLGLPNDAIAPGAQGQLGFGASYFAANSRNTNTAMVFAKQGYIRFKGLGGAPGQSLKLGRMEFIDGTEAAPSDPTLAALKRDRIAHRLIGNFGFSDVGRSFDGVEYSLDRANLNFILLAARPTRGVFQVDGWGELNANVFYGALTGQIPGKRASAEWRVFGLGYSDYRDGVVKTDNRSLAVRTADTDHINIGTYGGHYLQTVGSAAGMIDLLFWGALQNGSWGRLAQHSGAVATEAGWQPAVLSAVRPWLRGGFNYGSGDGNPNDTTHGTFFQILPTPRIYARFPFFNMMNNRDAFGELMLRPSKALSIRTDVHSLALANRNDLWYSGGGMFQPWTFGYTGRPCNGQSGLATLYDVSADYNANARASIGVYYGRAVGKRVIESIYPGGKNANIGYLELTLRM